MTAQKIGFDHFIDDKKEELKQLEYDLRTQEMRDDTRGKAGAIASLKRQIRNIKNWLKKHSI